MRLSRSAIVRLAVVVAAAVWLAACGSGQPLVLDLSTQPESVANHYRFIASHRELAEQVTCYCGCGKTLKHRHLRDCYVRDDGTYDPHGAGCGICALEATQIKQWDAEGVPAAEIATRIDQQLSTAGPPTRKR